MSREPRRKGRLAALALVLPACSPDGPRDEQSGPELYRVHCAQCHGSAGKGSPLGLGPGLAGAGEHWDAASLLVYLDDPAAYAARDERLGARPMPALAPAVPPEARRRLVEHVLRLMGE